MLSPDSAAPLAKHQQASGLNPRAKTDSQSSEGSNTSSSSRTHEALSAGERRFVGPAAQARLVGPTSRILRRANQQTTDLFLPLGQSHVVAGSYV